MVTKSPCKLGFKSELSTKVKVSPLHSTGKIKENDKIEGYCIFLLIRHVFPYKKVCFSRLDFVTWKLNCIAKNTLQSDKREIRQF